MSASMYARSIASDISAMVTGEVESHLGDYEERIDALEEHELEDLFERVDSLEASSRGDIFEDLANPENFVLENRERVVSVEDSSNRIGARVQTMEKDLSEFRMLLSTVCQAVVKYVEKEAS